jgi:CBS domain-containing protein
MARASKKTKKSKVKKMVKKVKKLKKIAKKAKKLAKLAKKAKPVVKAKPSKKVKAAKLAKAVKAAKQEERSLQKKVVQEGQEPVIRTLPQQIIRAGPEEVQNIPITSVMRKGVMVIDSEKTASDAARAMTRNRIGSLVVTERGKAVGIITERDMTRKLLARDRHGTVAIKEVMSTPIRVIEEDKTVKDAVMLMKRYGIKRLPVMDKKKRLIGIVTDTDVTRALPGMMDLMIELSSISRFEAGIESVGVCNRCGMWSESLANIQGEFLCDECKKEEEEENEE